MQKTFVTLLATALVGTALTGCTPDAKPEADNNANQAQQQPKQNEAVKHEQGTTPAQNEGTMQAEKDPSHDELRTAFDFDSEYMTLPGTAFGAIAMGEYNLPLEQPERLELAKAISSAYGSLGWKNDDKPPALFVKKDGSGFALGFKQKDGKLLATFWDVQPDKTYKNTKTETK